jgi:hypothetical protein
MNSVQFLHDTLGNPVFAVLSIDHYRQLTDQNQSVIDVQPLNLLVDGSFTVKLPYGGADAYLDIRALVRHLLKNGISDLAINQRAQSLDQYPPEQRMTLDPIIRHDFLPASSPYKNTMQATAEVVEALVKSGYFVRIKKKYPYLSRTVNALAIVAEKAADLE